MKEYAVVTAVIVFLLFIGLITHSIKETEKNTLRSRTIDACIEQDGVPVFIDNNINCIFPEKP